MHDNIRYYYIISMLLEKYRKSSNKRYEQQLIRQSSLADQQYTYNKIQPGCFFWKELTATKSDTPRCLIPDTLILNDKDIQAMWVYTDSYGCIKNEISASFKEFVAKLTNFSSPNQLVAVLKRPIYQQKLTHAHEIKLLNSKYLINNSQQQFAPKNQVICIQRFIKSNGSRPFLCRTVYCKNSSAKCYLITNSRDYFDREQPENKRMLVKPGDKTNIVKSKQGKNLNETLNSLQQIVKYMQFFRGIQMTDIVGDFIKDEFGNWWLINIKAFKVLEKIKVNVKIKRMTSDPEQMQKQRYQKTKICRYCEKHYLESELTHWMTMRMIIQMDKYLVHLGKCDRWLKRSDISNVDAHCLYQEHKVCQRCYKLYSEIQLIMEAQTSFSKRLGCPLENSPKELIKNQTNQKDLWSRAKSKQIHKLKQGIPQTIKLGPNTNIIIKQNYPIRNDEITNQMIRFRFIVYLIEIDSVVKLGEGLNYYLEYSLFGKKAKYKLNTSLIEQGIIPLKKLKVLYFFANSIQEFQQYANNRAQIKINLILQHKNTAQKSNIGCLCLNIKDFMGCLNSKKDFYKFLDIEGVPYGWGLEGSIGITISQGYVDTSRMIFEKTQGEIYIPNQNYYLCQHLPEQWIEHIKNKHQQSKRHNMIQNPKIQAETPQLVAKNTKINQQTIFSVSQEQQTTEITWRDIVNKQINNYVKPKKRAMNINNHFHHNQ